MQNSGLGYCLNAFTSLNLIYKIPVLVTQGKDSFVAYVDGDHLDHYDNLNDAKKAIDNVIKELT